MLSLMRLHMKPRTLEEITADLEREWPESEPIYHRGWMFHAPFACGRCGLEIPAYQFAFARACGACDCGDVRARFRVGDRRWFLSGKAELTDQNDRWLISPDFIPASECEQYPRLNRERRPPPPKKPRSRSPLRPLLSR